MTDEGLPPLVDEPALARYLEERLPNGGGLSVERHQAGHSCETFFVTWGGREYVLRRPPRGAFLPTAHDVTREYRVLSALGATSVRAPRTFLMCEDEAVIGAPFYLMERRRGIVIRTELPDAFLQDDRAAIGEELVDALVEMHEVDWRACGLEGFGKPSGYLERQLRRWNGQMELTLPHTRPLSDLEKAGVWLHEHLPESSSTTLVHGDFKLDNVMFEFEPPARLMAIFDWEMATLGDPLADLGWMISFWREPSDEGGDVFADLNRVTTLPGFSSRAHLIDRYASATGQDVEALDWYVVLAIWKLAILLEGSYARHLAGMTDDPFFAQLEQGVPALASRALSIALG
ncbi:MAG: phosphotransferase family protein [Actinomycetota bacterium]